MQMTKNSAFLFSARLINALSILAIIVIVSRRLGPEIFGGYSFLHAVVITGIVIAGFGLDTFMVREVSRDTLQGSQILTSVLEFKFLSSLAVIAGISGIFFYFLNDAVLFRLLLIFSTVILLNSLSQTFWFYGDAFQKFQYHASLWTFSNVVKVPLVWLFITFKQELVMVIYGLLIAEAISLIISGCWVQRSFRLLPGKLSFHLLSPLFKKAWPLGIVFILSAFYFRIDMMMLEIMKGERAVALYSAAYKLIEFLSIVPGTVTMAALPGLSSDFYADVVNFRAMFFKTAILLGTGGGAIGSFLYFFSNHVILMLYGPLFFDSWRSLSILSGVVLFLFVNGYLAYVTIAADNDKAVVLIIVISTVINVILNLYLIPKYSHVGAALATLLSEIVMFFCYITLLVKTNIFIEQRTRTMQMIP
jgi:O-antigen/teichoic acid export membrane protein